MSTNPYQQALEALAYGMSGPAAPEKIEQSLEDLQRSHNWQVQADRLRREQNRAIEAARNKQNDLIVQREQERDRQQQQYALNERAAFRDSHIERILNAGGSRTDAEATLSSAWHEELARRVQMRWANSHAAGAI